MQLIRLYFVRARTDVPGPELLDRARARGRRRALDAADPARHRLPATPLRRAPAAARAGAQRPGRAAAGAGRRRAARAAALPGAPPPPRGHADAEGGGPLARA